MPKQMRCNQGHQWESGIGRAGQPVQVIPSCPMCGGPALGRWQEWQDLPLVPRLFLLAALLVLVPALGVGLWYWLHVQNELVRTAWTAHAGPVRSVAFSPDGRLVATGGDDHAAHLWEVGSGREAAALQGHAGPVVALAFAGDNQTIATVGQEGVVKIWDVPAGTKQASLPDTAPEAGVVFAPDSQTLAAVDRDNHVFLWSVAQHRLLARLEPHPAPVRALAFSPDGQLLASAAQDGTIRLWEVGRFRRPVPDQNLLLTPVQFSSLQVDPPLVRTLAFAGDNRTLVVGMADGNLMNWDTVTTRRDDVWLGHAGAVQTLVRAPGGRLLVSAGADGSVKVWEFADGRFHERAQHREAAGLVTGLAFSPEGKLLVVGKQDGTVAVWNLAGLLRYPPEKK